VRQGIEGWIQGTEMYTVQCKGTVGKEQIRETGDRARIFKRGDRPLRHRDLVSGKK
jgi:hypothetical protein